MRCVQALGLRQQLAAATEQVQQQEKSIHRLKSALDAAQTDLQGAQAEREAATSHVARLDADLEQLQAGGSSAARIKDLHTQLTQSQTALARTKEEHASKMQALREEHHKCCPLCLYMSSTHVCNIRVPAVVDQCKLCRALVGG